MRTQVDELKNMIKTISKGKRREENPDDIIIDWTDALKPAGRSKQSSSETVPSSIKKNKKKLFIKAGPTSIQKKAGTSSTKAGPTSRTKRKKAPRSPITSSEDSSDSSSSPDRSDAESHPNRSNKSSSSSSSSSPSPSPSTRHIYVHYDDIDKDLRNALRVSILFGYLPKVVR